MKAFWLKNHRADTLQSGDFLDMVKSPPRPHFDDKQAMLRWAGKPDTEHVFYSTYEPRYPGLRVTKDNPPAWIHGIVADYDTTLNEQEVINGLARIPKGFEPVAHSRTFSGGIRVVWAFERPIPAVSPEVTKAFLEKVDRALKLGKLCPGFDELAFQDPAKTFELGTDWRVLNPEAALPYSHLLVWITAAIEKGQFKTEVSLEWSVIKTEVERRWPGRWQGDFEVDRQGVRFWDANADNPKGCWLREHGVIAFSGEGRFLSWSEILGADWVRKHTDERLGLAISNIRTTGKAYWEKLDTGWTPFNAEQMTRRLVNVHGLNPKPAKGERSSEVSRAMTAIEASRVDGAFPFLFNRSLLVVHSGKTFLNVARAQIIPPAPTAAEWGVNFPWMAEYLQQLLGPEQLRHFNAEMHRMYRSAYEGRFALGHALFFAGPSSAGKTFLARRIIGDLMGGSEEGSNYLMGNTEFNRELCERAVATIDDAVAASDERGHAKYTAMIKKFVANPEMQYRPMYNDPVTLPWIGRAVVTMNEDPESVKMLPNTDSSNLDKMCFYLVNNTRVSFGKAEEIVKQELPHYAAWLLGHPVPDDLKDEKERFEIRPWHHPKLINSAREADSFTSFSELLDLWRREYFTAVPEKPEWVGTPTDLVSALSTTESISLIVQRNYTSANRVGRELAKLDRIPSSGVKKDHSANARNYRIKKP